MRFGTLRLVAGRDIPALFGPFGAVDLEEEAARRGLPPPPRAGRDFVTAWAAGDPPLRDLVHRALEAPLAVIPDRACAFLPPVPDPKLVIAVGLNYRSHCREQDREVPASPLFFAKIPSCLAGHRDPIPAWPLTSQMDYEAELAVVIGRPGRDIPLDRAMDHVAGYTVLNDVTARDLQRQERQWTRAKGLDGFGPCGPWWVSRDEIPDPQRLGIRTWVNGDLRQDSSTEEMVFPVALLVSRLSEAITLSAGDILSTGTPAGVGVFRKPPAFLAAGDRVVIEVEGVGRLENRVVAPGSL
ncbi:fumarylacetoacetate hydrolase family protein [Myxococcota bacterium]|jgi:2-keto-4-pentenoate hydratase/2-oxohepta-3-ene-1,7-dioic acid hydratase in catechol pathway|nr:fumarylacetoacetate hydrolase family protein [Myxococcota bacterium]